MRDFIPPFTMEFMEITPEIAADWLTRNFRNRKPKPAKLKFIVEDMMSGNWILTPEGLFIDVAGNLLNGQHRLLGIIETSLTFTFAIFRYKSVIDPLGLPIDRAAPRSAADIYQLKNRNIQLASRIAAVHLRRPGTLSEQKFYYDKFEDLIIRLHEACGSTARARTAAATKVGIIVRLSEASPQVQEEILEQYRQFVLLEFYASMWTSVQSLIRAFDRKPPEGHFEGMIKAYQAFNPVKRSLNKIYFKSQDIRLEEIRDQIGKHISDQE